MLIDTVIRVGDLTLNEMRDIDPVFVPHSHLGHIAALPSRLNDVGIRRGKPISLYALLSTREALKPHILNDLIRPDFLKTPSVEASDLRLFPIEVGQQKPVAGMLVEALPAQHSVSALGYFVSTKELRRFLPEIQENAPIDVRESSSSRSKSWSLRRCSATKTRVLLC